MSENQFDTLTLRKIFKRADVRGKTALVLSTWFGAGLVPKAPGTFGTLAGLPLVLIIKYFGSLYEALFLFAFVFLAIWASDRSCRLMGREDPSEVVIDEVAGYLLALFLVPSSWPAITLGFLLFRVFDIWKPFPIKRLEVIKGGPGIVLDDLMAGLYANMVLRVVLLLIDRT